MSDKARAKNHRTLARKRKEEKKARKTRAVNEHQITQVTGRYTGLGLVILFRSKKNWINLLLDTGATLTLIKIGNFDWKMEQQNAFELLKVKLTTAPILNYPDFTREFLVTTHRTLQLESYYHKAP
ncbi:hypothetical protein ALC56_02876 [Trachymyrmex septentrionalis]|uniref:Reverse transcriptase/retrotransposon-derived protein RNase H-like domain-containing protein n=1 Tax=Trachymyrmex septentrionalis TaxID=34720 RepID=A0A151K091_9HYME|nr:hypothetical protein ALC56_02876 [Trachymyrmex septentrionalis]